MNNCEKKIDALINALGFDVETNITKTYGQTIPAGMYGRAAAANKEFAFFPATSYMPEALYKEVIRTTDYKLTKKKPENTDKYCFSLLDVYRTTPYEVKP